MAHQKNREKHNKIDLDSRQAKISESIPNNYGGRTPDGDNNIKHPKGNIVGKVVTAVGLTTLLGVEAAKFVLPLLNNSSSESTSEGQGNTSSEVNSVIDNEHLSSSDPDYWNSLTETQQQGYNENRNKELIQRNKEDENK